MKQDGIIEMARQAGLLRTGDGWTEPARWGASEIEAFAKLVAEKECKDCAELCMDLHTLTDGAHNYYHFAANQILKRGEA